MLDKYKVILWDFDGVLMNSNEIRDLGFEKVLSSYPKHEVEELMIYHRKNGGLSRYVKFRYFFEVVRSEEVTDQKINELAEAFSIVMKELLVDSSLLIQDSLGFVEQNALIKTMHIVSGSDQIELRYLCQKMNIENYFKSIHGSPTPKKQLVKEIIEQHSYDKSEIILIGDSINDYEAAQENNIAFCGYNNELLRDLDFYIEQFAN
jgi:phosphoglycolate phosphatase-like HAD superfamily hydrolase